MCPGEQLRLKLLLENRPRTLHQKLALPRKRVLRFVVRILGFSLLTGGCFCIFQLGLWEHFNKPLQSKLRGSNSSSKIFKDFQTFESWFETRNKRILFVETSKGGRCFDYRQSCTVESAAFHNPSATIAILLNAKMIPHHCPTLEQFLNVSTESFDNVHFVYYDLEDVFKDTPLLDWGRSVKNGNITSSFMYSHLSDALRFALLHKYSTMYMDLDLITLRSLDKVFQLGNFLVKETGNQLSSAMMGFRRHHPFMLDALIEFAEHYNASDWAGNGPRLLDRVFAQWRCRLNETVCDNIHLVNHGHVYPMPWDHWELLFNASNTVYGPQLINDETVYALHLWNNISRNRSLNPTSERNTINILAENSCPRTFQLAKDSPLGSF